MGFLSDLVFGPSISSRLRTEFEGITLRRLYIDSMFFSSTIVRVADDGRKFLTTQGVGTHSHHQFLRSIGFELDLRRDPEDYTGKMRYSYHT